jgi:membrane protein
LAAAAAALVGTVAWQIANAGFAWYLSSGFARYPLVYGSLTTVIVLMFWLYLTMIIVLIGAHLSASIAHYQHSGPEA